MSTVIGVKFLEKYQEAMENIFELSFRNDDSKKIKALELLKEKIQTINKDDILKVSFKNDYSNSEVDLDLLKFTDWMYGQKNPILSGFGSTFKQHSESKNLRAELLKFLIKRRKTVKKEMFSYMEKLEEAKKDGNKELMERFSMLVKMKDLEQKIIKVLANSYNIMRLYIVIYKENFLNCWNIL